MAARESQRGVSIIEFIVAMGIFVIIAMGSATTVIQSLKLDQSSAQRDEVSRLAQEGYEAVRSIRNQGWGGVSTAGTYGLTSVGGVWGFSGTSETIGKYTRQIIIEDVYRDTTTNQIVTSGGMLDGDTKKIISRISWNDFSGTARTQEQSSYMVNFKTGVACADWATPVLESSHNIPSIDNAVKLQTQGQYAFTIRESGTPDFIAYDLSDTSNPNPKGNEKLDGGQSDLAVLGNEAYVASASDTREMQIVDIEDPPVLVKKGFYNAPGTADALGIHLDVNKLYLTRAFSSNQEFLILNVSNPNTPGLWSATSLLDLSGSAMDVMVMGNYAYVITDNDAEDLQIIDVSDPVSPFVAARVNVPTSNDGRSITGFNNKILVGFADGPLYAYDMTNPLSPVYLGYYNAADDVKYIAISPDEKCAFLATDRTDPELQIVSIVNLSNMFYVSGLDLGDKVNGVAFSSFYNRILVATAHDNGEFSVIEP